MISMSVKGIPKARGFLKETRIRKNQALNKEIHKQGFLLESEIKESIAGRKAEPRSHDTGRFMSSIGTDNKKKNQSKVFTNVKYAKYLEFGTSKGIKARRHFRNSKDRRRPKIIAGIKQALK